MIEPRHDLHTAPRTAQGILQLVAQPHLAEKWEPEMRQMSRFIFDIKYCTVTLYGDGESGSIIFRNAHRLRFEENGPGSFKTKLYVLNEDVELKRSPAHIGFEETRTPNITRSHCNGNDVLEILFRVSQMRENQVGENWPERKFKHFEALCDHGYSKAEAEALVGNTYILDDQINSVVARHCNDRTDQDKSIRQLKQEYPV